MKEALKISLQGVVVYAWEDEKRECKTKIIQEMLNYT